MKSAPCAIVPAADLFADKGVRLLVEAAAAKQIAEEQTAEQACFHLLCRWGLVIEKADYRPIEADIRLHLVIARLAGAKKSERSEPSRHHAEREAQRKRLSQFKSAIDALDRVWREDTIATPGYQLTEVLSSSDRRHVMLALHLTQQSLLVQEQRLLCREEGEEPRRHMTWAGLIQSLWKHYQSLGGSSGDNFLAGLVAMNDAFPPPSECNAKLSSVALRKRVRRTLGPICKGHYPARKVGNSG
jgi:hypothetical protein